MNFKQRSQKQKKNNESEDIYFNLPLKSKGKKYLYSHKLNKEITCKEILEYNKKLPYNILKSILKIEEKNREISPIIEHTKKLLLRGFSPEEIINNTKITFKKNAN